MTKSMTILSQVENKSDAGKTSMTGEKKNGPWFAAPKAFFKQRKYRWMTGYDILVCLALRASTKRKGVDFHLAEADISLKNLARAARCGKTTVKRTLARLYLHRMLRKPLRLGQGRPNHYVLLDPENNRNAGKQKYQAREPSGDSLTSENTRLESRRAADIYYNNIRDNLL